MKLAALYSVFNGLELLEKSIEQIEKHVDFIVICYQTTSNKGEKRPEVSDFVQRFTGKKFYLLPFEPDLSLNTKQNERQKLQNRLDFAKVLGATHFFSIATDHFYEPEIFEKHKSIASKYDVTFTKMFTYYKYPTWQLSPPENYYMPFICRLYPETKVIRAHNYPVRVDPSIQVNTCNSYRVFDLDEIAMHHYSMIRVDIDDKFRNAAASIRWNSEQIARFKSEFENAKLGDSISYFQSRVLIQVPNYFHLH